MSSRYKGLTIGIALFVVFSVVQGYVGVSVAVSQPLHRERRVKAQEPTGILTTRGRDAISVNGNGAVTDATILPGASIETPLGVGASINLGPLGRVDVAPNASLKLDFSAQTVKIALLKGCIILHTKANTTGTVEVVKGIVGTTDPAKDDVLDVCQSEDAGSEALVNQGAAESAGAGAVPGGSATGTIAGATSGATSAAAGGAAGASATTASAGGWFGGLSTTATVAVIGGYLALVIIPIEEGIRGNNPSPSSP